MNHIIHAFRKWFDILWPTSHLAALSRPLEAASRAGSRSATAAEAAAAMATVPFQARGEEEEEEASQNALPAVSYSGVCWHFQRGPKTSRGASASSPSRLKAVLHGYDRRWATVQHHKSAMREQRAA